MKFAPPITVLLSSLALASCGGDSTPATDAAGQAPVAAPSTVSTSPSAATDAIRGRVRSANGPEAGVWVIAETRDLGTRFARTVVTDDNGNYLIPGLPDATYDIWVRGYGLVDSAKVQAAPGSRLDLDALVAPDAAAAARLSASRVAAVVASGE